MTLGGEGPRSDVGTVLPPHLLGHGHHGFPLRHHCGLRAHGVRRGPSVLVLLSVRGTDEDHPDTTCLGTGRPIRPVPDRSHLGNTWTVPIRDVGTVDSLDSTIVLHDVWTVVIVIAHYRS